MTAVIASSVAWHACLIYQASECLQGVLDFKGGETAALARLKYYLWDTDLIATYFDTRNGMVGESARWWRCGGRAVVMGVCLRVGELLATLRVVSLAGGT